MPGLSPWVGRSRSGDISSAGSASHGPIRFGHRRAQHPRERVMRADEADGPGGQDPDELIGLAITLTLRARAP
jgi:hypothetical protein